MDDPLLNSIQLEFLYEDFMILRTLVKRTGKKLNQLICKSRDIIYFLLDLISEQARAAKPVLSSWEVSDMALRRTSGSMDLHTYMACSYVT